MSVKEITNWLSYWQGYKDALKEMKYAISKREDGLDETIKHLKEKETGGGKRE